MKKLILLMLILIIPSLTVFTEDVSWGSVYGSGNLILEAEAALETDGAAQLAVYPAAEMIIWKPVFGNFAFFDVGGAVKGRAGIPVSAGSDFSAGAALLATAHLGFRGFDFTGAEYLANLDLFAEAGFKFDFITSGTGPGFTMKSGINYFISEKLALGAYYSYWGSHSGGGLSVSLKLGETPDVAGFSIDMPEEAVVYAVNPRLLQFYTLYYSANYAGGGYPESFTEGQEAVYRVSVMDSDGMSTYRVSKSLLKAKADRAGLWGLEYSDDEESFYYEYIEDENGNITNVYYRDPGGEAIKIDAAISEGPEAEYLTWEDYPAEKRSRVSVNVEAGKFMTDEYHYTDESGAEVFWWLSDEVPGKLVSYKMEDSSGIVTSELIELNTGRIASIFE